MSSTRRLFLLALVGLVVAGCGGKASRDTPMTSEEAIRAAHAAAKDWTDDALLFAVIGVEHGPAASVKSPPPHQTKADEGARVYPCGPMDEEAWAIMDPAWPGRADTNPGDGRMTAWQVVYFSKSRDQGTGFVIRSDRDPVCVADPLNAQDRQELQRVTSKAWSTDSAEAMTAIRGRSVKLDAALASSRTAQISYGFDLRAATTWGIKGHAADEGVSSFYAVVDLENANVRSIEVK